MKKLLAMLMAVCLLAGYLDLNAFAETADSGMETSITDEIQEMKNEITVEDIALSIEKELDIKYYKPYSDAKYELRYYVDEEGVVIIGSDHYTSESNWGDLVIPSEIDGVTVYRIREYAFAGESNFQGRLTLSNSIKEIGHDAFSFCSGLTGELVLPENLKSVENNTFQSCGFTGTLKLPVNVECVGLCAFQYCMELNQLVLTDGLKTIEESAFEYCSSLSGELMLPDSLTYIGDHAFDNCSSLSIHAKLPNHLETLGSYAFFNCYDYTGDLVLPAGLRSIGDWAFHSIQGRNFTGQLVLPDSLESIGDRSFGRCDNFTGELKLPAGLKCIGEEAFIGGSGFTGSLILPDSLKSIGAGAFFGCSGFTGDLIIPDAIECIENETFLSCKGFNGKLVLPSDLKYIGEEAFYNCEGLTGDLIIPDGIECIENETFRSCKGFNGKLVLPSALKYIGEEAFYGCEGIVGDLIIPNGVERIGKGAFAWCDGFNGKIVLPDSLKTIEKAAFVWCEGLTGILVIPASVEKIDALCFCMCNSLSNDVYILGSTTTLSNSEANNMEYISNPTPLSNFIKEEILHNITIHAPKGSVAETYALENGYSYSADMRTALGIFEDIKNTDWFVDAVQFAYDNKVMSGVSSTEFAPDGKLTRAMFVKMLHNRENSPAWAYDSLFLDVPDGQWYTTPVLWAQSVGITKGVGEGRFGTDTNITREQLATMLYSYAKYKGYDVTINGNALDSFPDKGKVHNWGEEGMKWAVSHGVVNGKGTSTGNILDPEGVASRAEGAQMMKNLIEKVINK